jgi:hypothetical protein
VRPQGGDAGAGKATPAAQGASAPPAAAKIGSFKLPRGASGPPPRQAQPIAGRSRFKYVRPPAAAAQAPLTAPRPAPARPPPAAAAAAAPQAAGYSKSRRGNSLQLDAAKPSGFPKSQTWRNPAASAPKPAAPAAASPLPAKQSSKWNKYVRRSLRLSPSPAAAMTMKAAVAGRRRSFRLHAAAGGPLPKRAAPAALARAGGASSQLLRLGSGMYKVRKAQQNARAMLRWSTTACSALTGSRCVAGEPQGRVAVAHSAGRRPPGSGQAGPGDCSSSSSSCCACRQTRSLCPPAVPGAALRRPKGRRQGRARQRGGPAAQGRAHRVLPRVLPLRGVPPTRARLPPPPRPDQARRVPALAARRLRPGQGVPPAAPAPAGADARLQAPPQGEGRARGAEPL